jgi:hypothetical protein
MIQPGLQPLVAAGVPAVPVVAGFLVKVALGVTAAVGVIELGPGPKPSICRLDDCSSPSVGLSLVQ